MLKYKITLVSTAHSLLPITSVANTAFARPRSIPSLELVRGAGEAENNFVLSSEYLQDRDCRDDLESWVCRLSAISTCMSRTSIMYYDREDTTGGIMAY